MLAGLASRGASMQRAVISTILGLCLLAQGAAAQTLQDILNGLVVSGPAIDANAPAPIEAWNRGAGPLNAQLVGDFTPTSDINFGIYDTDSLAQALLLSDDFLPDEVVLGIFRDDGSINVRGGLATSPVFGFEGPFGFFVTNESETFYTEVARNSDGPRAKVFQGNGTTVLKLAGLSPGAFLPSQFLIAWETGIGDANDGEYNDFLVLVSSILPIVPVPEPAFALVLGVSALALVCGRRARSN